MRTSEVFRRRGQEWKNQLDFIQDLADANDIEFDASGFRKPRRYIKGFCVLWHQSDAALYIAQQLHERRIKGLPVFNPWSAAWLVIDAGKVERQPFFYVPIIDDELEKLDGGKIRAYVFSTKRGQAPWLSSKTGITAHVICKHCLYRWTHHTSGHLNPDDTVSVTDKAGKAHTRLRCPNCGGLEIYKEGFHIH